MGWPAGIRCIPALPCQPRQQAVAQRLAQLFNGMRKRARQPPGAGGVFHRAGGAYALLPQPKLCIKAIRVGLAIRRAQARRELPALSRPQCRCGAARRHEPGQLQLPGNVQRCVAGPCGGAFSLQHKAQTRGAALRHGGDDAREPHIARLRCDRQRLRHAGGHVRARRTPARRRAGKNQQGQRQRPRRWQPTAMPQAAQQPGCQSRRHGQRQGRTAALRRHRQGSQHLTGRACHPGRQPRQQPRACGLGLHAALSARGAGPRPQERSRKRL